MNDTHGTEAVAFSPVGIFGFTSLLWKRHGMATDGKRGSRPSNRTTDEIAEERIAEWRLDHVRMAGDDRDRGRDEYFKRFGGKTRTLGLTFLGLGQVPESVRELYDLEILDLTGNNINPLPAWIGELRSLKGLVLTSNRLRSLPAEIGSLRHLTVLVLDFNDLIELPESLQTLPLRELDLRANPELGIPTSVLEGSPQEILRYYFESRAEDGRPLLELKGYAKLRLKPGESGSVRLELSTAELRYLGPDLQPLFEAGEVEILVGPSADHTGLLRQTITLQTMPLTGIDAP